MVMVTESPWVYASVQEFLTQVGKVGRLDDDLFSALLFEASREVDRVCNRPDGFRASQQFEARTYVGRGGRVLWIDDCVEVQAVAVKAGPTDTTFNSWQATDWLAARGDPTNPDFNHLPYTFLLVPLSGAFAIWTNGHFSGRRSPISLQGFTPDMDAFREPFGVPTVQVTGRFGYADDTPGVIKQATITYAARWWKRGQAAWADAVADSNTGILLYKKPMDPDIVGMLRDGRYIRPAA